jgi:hypothetical protein
MLVSRLILALGFLALPAFSSELFLTVQPIQVCNSAGTSCGDPTRQLFEPTVNAIWAQANITVTFLPWETIDNDAYFSGTALTDLFLSNPSALTPSPLYSYLYMVPQSVMGAFGCCEFKMGIVGFPLALIGDDVFGDSSGNTHPGAIAHELGHAMGLPEATGSSDLLMTYDGAALPGNINDVYPTGTNYQVPGDQATSARTSPLLTTEAVPEPGTMALSLGFVVLAFARRRQFAR